MSLLIVPFENISIPKNRQRTDLDTEEGQAYIVQLADSIQATEKEPHNCLLHPIVLRYKGKVSDEGTFPRMVDEWELVAGECRLRAMKLINDLGGKLRCNNMDVAPGCAAATNIGDLPYIAARRAELEENIRRKDLSWQDKAKATAELEQLMRDERAESGQAAPTTAEVSLEIRGSDEGSNHQATREELILAQHMDNPVVAKAKTRKDAFKALKREENLAKHARLAGEIGKTFTSAVHRLERGNAVEITYGLPPESFDVIVTDPPYNMGADEFGDGGGKAPGGAHLYKDNDETWAQVRVTLARFTVVAKPQAHLYVFCDLYRFTELKSLLEDTGWKVFRTPLVWYKPDGNRIPWIDKGPQRQYELILFASKGDKLVNKMGSDVLTCKQDHNLGHQAQKPVALYRELLARSGGPGQSCLDAFCGTGPIFPAAHELKMKATGIEQLDSAYGIAAQRIKELV